jgi:hypothetical protein
VQCSAVQCSAVQCSAVQCSAVQCSDIPKQKLKNDKNDNCEDNLYNLQTNIGNHCLLFVFLGQHDSNYRIENMKGSIKGSKY